MKVLAASLALFGAAFGQAPPEGSAQLQREAYRHWRATDPDLERDAVSAGATLGARADKVAAGATSYFSLRKDYLEIRIADARHGASLLAPVVLSDEPLPNLDHFLTSQDTILKSTIDTIARDPDRAIQQLRASLERERSAIAAIGAGLKDSRKSQETAAESNRMTEEERAKTLDDYQKLTAGLEESAQLADKLGSAWGGYYRELSGAAREAAAPLTSPASALAAAAMIRPRSGPARSAA